MSEHTCGSGWQGNCAACERVVRAEHDNAEHQRALEKAVVEAAMRRHRAPNDMAAMICDEQIDEACAALRRHRGGG